MVTLHKSDRLIRESCMMVWRKDVAGHGREV